MQLIDGKAGDGIVRHGAQKPGGEEQWIMLNADEGRELGGVSLRPCLIWRIDRAEPPRESILRTDSVEQSAESNQPNSTGWGQLGDVDCTPVASRASPASVRGNACGSARHPVRRGGEASKRWETTRAGETPGLL